MFVSVKLSLCRVVIGRPGVIDSGTGMIQIARMDGGRWEVDANRVQQESSAVADDVVSINKKATVSTDSNDLYRWVRSVWLSICLHLLLDIRK